MDINLLFRRHRMACGWIFLTVAAFVAPSLKGEGDLPKRSGSVVYQPTSDESTVAERYRLAAHRFDYIEELRPKVSDRISISHVTFPSPVQTDVLENNTVHCEYYR